jgi:hypothetical protein
MSFTRYFVSGYTRSPLPTRHDNLLNFQNLSPALGSSHRGPEIESTGPTLIRGEDRRVRNEGCCPASIQAELALVGFTREDVISANISTDMIIVVPLTTVMLGTIAGSRAFEWEALLMLRCTLGWCGEDQEIHEC